MPKVKKAIKYAAKTKYHVFSAYLVETRVLVCNFVNRIFMALGNTAAMP